MIEKGSTRSVIILRNYVIKFPRFDKFFSQIKFLFRIIKLRRFSLLNKGFICCVDVIKASINANWSEYRCWKLTRAKFLAKTYFSCGVINIQRRENGKVVDEQCLYKSLGKINCRNEIWTIDPHCLESVNFKQNNRGYVLVDYGDNTSGMPFSSFIIKWHKEIEKVLS